MAAGAPILASDLERVPPGAGRRPGRAMFPAGDPAALAAALDRLLDDPDRRAPAAAVGSEVVAPYDWPVVARYVLAVYETVDRGEAGVR